MKRQRDLCKFKKVVGSVQYLGTRANSAGVLYVSLLLRVAQVVPLESPLVVHSVACLFGNHRLKVVFDPLQSFQPLILPCALGVSTRSRSA